VRSANLAAAVVRTRRRKEFGRRSQPMG
jgi:hypothetical protein